MNHEIFEIASRDFSELAHLTRRKIDWARANGLTTFYATAERLIVESPSAKHGAFQKWARDVQTDWLKALRQSALTESRRRAFSLEGSVQSDVFFGVFYLDGQEINFNDWFNVKPVERSKIGDAEPVSA